jgi:hypothetical protein
MASKHTLRFFIKDRDKPRALLSVSERPNGDLVLRMRAGGVWRDTGALLPGEARTQLHGRPFRQQHYSVHVSPNSPTGINVIKWTCELDDGEKVTLGNYSRAIKRDKTFAPIFVHRCSNLEGDAYDLRTKDAELISLGDYDPALFSLVYMVMVGPRGYSIHPNPASSVQMVKHDFSQFNLTVIWSFLSVAASVTCYTLHCITKPDLEFQSFKTADDFEAFFGLSRQSLHDEYVQILRPRDGLGQIWPLIKNAAYFREGVKSRNYMEWAARSLGLPPLPKEFK